MSKLPFPKCLLVVLAVSMGAVIAVIKTSAPAFAGAEISAERFRLVDAQGKTRARLGLSGGNQKFTFLNLYDSQGRPRLRVVVDSNQKSPSMQFLDPDGSVITDLPKTAFGSSARLKKVKDPSRKTDEVTPQSIRNIQNQIDEIRLALNALIDQLNASR